MSDWIDQLADKLSPRPQRPTREVVASLLELKNLIRAASTLPPLTVEQALDEAVTAFESPGYADGLRMQLDAARERMEGEEAQLLRDS